MRARGRGTFCAVDLPTVAARCIYDDDHHANDDDDNDDHDLGHHGIDQISDQGHLADEAEAPRGSLGWLWRSQR